MWPLKKNAPPLIIGTNLLTKFHDDRKINVTSRVLTRKIVPPRGGHVFQPTGIIFELFQDIIGMNLLTEFHEDRTINVASRVLTRFYYSLYSHIRKNDPPLGGHVFQANVTLFELIQDISKTNLLTKFHRDWTISVASGVLTRKNAPPPGGHVFQPTGIIFELEKCPPPLGSHVFQAKVTISELIQDISGTNLLSKKNAPPPGGHVFQPTNVIFELVQDIIRMNLLTKFYEDWTINVASRLKNAPPLGSHVYQANFTIFELIETNLLTKFHEDWTINVASRHCSSSHCVNTFFVTVNNGGGGVILFRLSSDNHLVDGPTDRQTDKPT
ncbi:hypothetical protein DPMN_129776 [Dreissena polymorpha]|uniref:Uncharacterized protein n=1 Tax=Dreissena polymorpha TaxID=45954 RepID=A0A9D4H5I9_DREPO|nr:hypothetical protein DPMN_129776 [Dreissena polymorpha]